MSANGHIAGKVPPHDLTAEGAVLSAMINDPRSIDTVVDILGAEDFYSSANGKIFSVIIGLRAANEAVDPVSVAGVFHRQGKLAEIGGSTYISELIDGTPSVAHVDTHAKFVLDAARKRRLIAECHIILSEGYGDTGPAQEWLDASEARVSNAVRAKSLTSIATMHEALVGAAKELEEAQRYGGMVGYPTGFTDLDRMLGGLRRGNVTVIGARASMGKTALAGAIAQHVARDECGGGVLMFSMEMLKEELAQRWTMAEAGLDVYRLRQTGKFTPDEWSRFGEASASLARLPLLIDDSTDLTPQAMLSRARRMRARFEKIGDRLALIVVDYIQLMNGRAGLPKGASREQEISAISRSIKVMAGELDCHVIAVAQLNRSVESRTVKDKRPVLSDLRESGSIEQDANNVILVYRDEYYHEDSADRGIAELIIAKQRAGMRNVIVPVAFNASLVKFGNLARHEREAFYDRKR